MNRARCLLATAALLSIARHAQGIDDCAAVANSACVDCLDATVAGTGDFTCGCRGVVCAGARSDIGNKATMRCTAAACAAADCCTTDECLSPSKGGACTALGQVCNDPDPTVATPNDWTCDCTGVTCDAAAGLRDILNKNMVSCAQKACTQAVCCTAVTDECLIPTKGGACTALGQLCNDPVKTAAVVNDWTCDCTGVTCDAAAGLRDIANKGAVTCAQTACTQSVCCTAVTDECLIPTKGGACTALGQLCNDPVKTAAVVNDWTCDCTGVTCSAADGVKDIANKGAVTCAQTACTQAVCCVAVTAECLLPSKGGMCTALGQVCTEVDATAAVLDDWSCDCTGVTCDASAGLRDILNKNMVACAQAACTQAVCCTAVTDECMIPTKGGACTALGQLCNDPVKTAAVVNDWTCDCTGVTCDAAAGLRDIANKGAVTCAQTACTQSVCCTAVTDECLIPTKGGACTALGQVCNDPVKTAAVVNDWTCDCTGVTCSAADGVKDIANKGAVTCAQTACTQAVCCVAVTAECLLPSKGGMCTALGQVCTEVDATAAVLDDWSCDCTGVTCDASAGLRDILNKDMVACAQAVCTQAVCCTAVTDECLIPTKGGACTALGQLCNDPVKTAAVVNDWTCDCTGVTCDAAAGLRDIANKGAVTCAQTACTQSVCCTAVTDECLIPTKGGACTALGQLCNDPVKTAAVVNDWTCDCTGVTCSAADGVKDIANKGAVTCAQTACTQAVCCVAVTAECLLPSKGGMCTALGQVCTEVDATAAVLDDWSCDCTGVTCDASAGLRDILNKNMVACAQAACTQAVCCTAVTDECLIPTKGGACTALGQLCNDPVKTAAVVNDWTCDCTGVTCSAADGVKDIANKGAVTCAQTACTQAVCCVAVTAECLLPSKGGMCTALGQVCTEVDATAAVLDDWSCDCTGVTCDASAGLRDILNKNMVACAQAACTQAVCCTAVTDECLIPTKGGACTALGQLCNDPVKTAAVVNDWTCDCTGVTCSAADGVKDIANKGAVTCAQTACTQAVCCVAVTAECLLPSKGGMCTALGQVCTEVDATAAVLDDWSCDCTGVTCDASAGLRDILNKNMVACAQAACTQAVCCTAVTDECLIPTKGGACTALGQLCNDPVKTAAVVNDWTCDCTGVTCDAAAGLRDIANKGAVTCAQTACTQSVCCTAVTDECMIPTKGGACTALGQLCNDPVKTAAVVNDWTCDCTGVTCSAADGVKDIANKGAVTCAQTACTQAVCCVAVTAECLLPSKGGMCTALGQVCTEVDATAAVLDDWSCDCTGVTCDASAGLRDILNKNMVACAQAACTQAVCCTAVTDECLIPTKGGACTALGQLCNDPVKTAAVVNDWTCDCTGVTCDAAAGLRDIANKGAVTCAQTACTQSVCCTAVTDECLIPTKGGACTALGQLCNDPVKTAAVVNDWTCDCTGVTCSAADGVKDIANKGAVTCAQTACTQAVCCVAVTAECLLPSKGGMCTALGQVCTEVDATAAVLDDWSCDCTGVTCDASAGLRDILNKNMVACAQAACTQAVCCTAVTDECLIPTKGGACTALGQLCNDPVKTAAVVNDWTCDCTGVTCDAAAGLRDIANKGAVTCAQTACTQSVCCTAVTDECLIPTKGGACTALGQLCNDPVKTAAVVNDWTCDCTGVTCDAAAGLRDIANKGAVTCAQTACTQSVCCTAVTDECLIPTKGGACTALGQLCNDPVKTAAVVNDWTCDCTGVTCSAADGVKDIANKGAVTCAQTACTQAVCCVAVTAECLLPSKGGMCTALGQVCTEVDATAAVLDDWSCDCTGVTCDASAGLRDILNKNMVACAQAACTQAVCCTAVTDECLIPTKGGACTALGQLCNDPVKTAAVVNDWTCDCTGVTCSAADGVKDIANKGAVTCAQTACTQAVCCVAVTAECLLPSKGGMCTALGQVCTEVDATAAVLDDWSCDCTGVTCDASAGLRDILNKNMVACAQAACTQAVCCTAVTDECLIPTKGGACTALGQLCNDPVKTAAVVNDWTCDCTGVTCSAADGVKDIANKGAVTCAQTACTQAVCCVAVTAECLLPSKGGMCTALGQVCTEVDATAAVLDDWSCDCTGVTCDASAGLRDILNKNMVACAQAACTQAVCCTAVTDECLIPTKGGACTALGQLCNDPVKTAAVVNDWTCDCTGVTCSAADGVKDIANKGAVTCAQTACTQAVCCVAVTAECLLPSKGGMCTALGQVCTEVDATAAVLDDWSCDCTGVTCDASAGLRDILNKNMVACAQAACTQAVCCTAVTDECLIPTKGGACTALGQLCNDPVKTAAVVNDWTCDCTGVTCDAAAGLRDIANKGAVTCAQTACTQSVCCTAVTDECLIPTKGGACTALGQLCNDPVKTAAVVNDWTCDCTGVTCSAADGVKDIANKGAVTCAQTACTQAVCCVAVTAECLLPSKGGMCTALGQVCTEVDATAAVLDDWSCDCTGVTCDASAGLRDILNKNMVACAQAACTQAVCCTAVTDECLIPTKGGACTALGQLCNDPVKTAAVVNDWTCDCTGVTCSAADGVKDIANKGAVTCAQTACTQAVCCVAVTAECLLPSKGGMCTALGQVCTEVDATAAVLDDWSCDCTGVTCDASAGLRDILNKNMVACAQAACTQAVCCTAVTDECMIPTKGGACTALGQLCNDPVKTAAVVNDWTCDCTGVTCSAADGVKDIANKGAVTCAQTACTQAVCCVAVTAECLLPSKGGMCTALGQVCTEVDATAAVLDDWSCDCTGVTCDASAGLRDILNKNMVACAQKACTQAVCCTAVTDECMIPTKGGACTALGQLCNDPVKTAAVVNDWTCDCTGVTCSAADGVKDIANKGAVTCAQTACTQAVCCVAVTAECLLPSKGGMCTALGQVCTEVDATAAVLDDWSCDCTGVTCDASAGLRDILNKNMVACAQKACTQAVCCTAVTDECMIPTKGGACTALGQLCNDPVKTAAVVNDWTCDCTGVTCDAAAGLRDIANKGAVTCAQTACTQSVCCTAVTDECMIPTKGGACTALGQLCNDPVKTAAVVNDWTCDCTGVTCSAADGVKDIANKGAVTCAQTACTQAVCCVAVTAECLLPSKGGMCTALGQVCTEVDATAAVLDDWSCDCTGVTCDASAGLRDILNKNMVACAQKACTQAVCCTAVTDECMIPTKGGACTALGQLCNDPVKTAAVVNDWTCDCTGVTCSAADGVKDIANKGAVTCAQTACTQAVCCVAVTAECLLPSKGGMCTALGQVCTEVDATAAVLDDWSCDCTGVTCDASAGLRDILNKNMVACAQKACTQAVCCTAVTDECMIPTKGGACTALGQLCNDPVKTAAVVNDWTCDCTGVTCSAADGVKDIANKGAVTCAQTACTQAVCCVAVTAECLLPSKGGMCTALGQVCTEVDATAAVLDDWSCDCTGVTCSAAAGLMDIAGKAAVACAQKACTQAVCCVALANECLVSTKGGVCAAAGQSCNDPVATAASLNDWTCDCTGVVCSLASKQVDKPNRGAVTCSQLSCRTTDCCDTIEDECVVEPLAGVCAAAGQACNDPVKTAGTKNDWTCNCAGVYCDPSVGLSDLATKAAHVCPQHVCTPKECCVENECALASKGGVCRAAGQKCTDPDAAVADNWTCDCTGFVCNAADGLMDIAAKAGVTCNQAPCTVTECCGTLVDECQIASNLAVCNAAGQVCFDDKLAANLNNWACDCSGVYCDPAMGLRDHLTKGAQRCVAARCTPAECCIDQANECNVPANYAICNTAKQYCFDPDVAVANDWQCDCTNLECDPNSLLEDPADKATRRCLRGACKTADCCVALTDECVIPNNLAVCSGAGQQCIDDKIAANRDNWNCDCSGVYCDPAMGLRDHLTKGAQRCLKSRCTPAECCIDQANECNIPANYAICNTAKQYCFDPDVAVANNWQCDCTNLECDPNSLLEDPADKATRRCLRGACKTADCCVALTDECLIPNNLAVCSGAGQQCIDDKIAANRDNWNCDCSGVYCDPAMGLRDHLTKGAQRCLKSRCTPAECCIDQANECNVPANYAICNTAKQYCFDPDVAVANDWQCDCTNLECDPNSLLEDPADKATRRCLRGACKTADCCVALTDECLIPNNLAVCSGAGQQCIDDKIAANRDNWNCDCSGVYCDPAMGLRDHLTKGAQRCLKSRCTPAECCIDQANECNVPANYAICNTAKQYCFDPDVAVANDWQCDCTNLECDPNSLLEDPADKATRRCLRGACKTADCCVALTDECLIPNNLAVCSGAGQQCIDDKIAANRDNWNCDCSGVYCDPAMGLRDHLTKGAQRCLKSRCTPAECCIDQANECTIPANYAICNTAKQYCSDPDTTIANNWQCDCTDVECDPNTMLQDHADKANRRCLMGACKTADCCVALVDECRISVNYDICNAAGQKCIDEVAGPSNWNCDCTGVFCDPALGMMDIAGKVGLRCAMAPCTTSVCCTTNENECLIAANYAVCNAVGQKCTDPSNTVGDWTCDCTGVFCDPALGMMDTATKLTHRCAGIPCTTSTCCMDNTNECLIPKNYAVCNAVGQQCIDNVATPGNWECDCTGVFCNPALGMMDIAAKAGVRCALGPCTTSVCCIANENECLIAANYAVCNAVGQKCTDPSTAVAADWQCDCTGVFCDPALGMVDTATKATTKCTGIPCTTSTCCATNVDECLIPTNNAVCRAVGQQCFDDKLAANLNNWQCDCTSVYCDPNVGLVDIAAKAAHRCPQKQCAVTDCCAVDECTVPAKGGLCRAAGQKCTDADTAVANNWQCDCTGIVCKAADGLMDLAAKAAHKCTAAPCTVGDCCVALTDECNDARKGVLCAAAGQLCTDQTAATANDWQCHCTNVFCDPGQGLVDIANKGNVRCDLKVCTPNDCCAKNVDECLIPTNNAVCRAVGQQCFDDKLAANLNNWQCDCTSVYCDPNVGLVDIAAKAAHRCPQKQCAVTDCCAVDECTVPAKGGLCRAAGQKCTDADTAVANNWQCDCTGIVCKAADGLMDLAAKAAHKCTAAPCTVGDCCVALTDECKDAKKGGLCAAAGQLCTDQTAATANDWQCHCTNVFCDPGQGLVDIANKGNVRCDLKVCTPNDCCAVDECTVPAKGGLCRAAGQKCTDADTAVANNWQCDCTGIVCKAADGLMDLAAKAAHKCTAAPCTVGDCCVALTDECKDAKKGGLCAVAGQLCTDQTAATANDWQCHCTNVFCDPGQGLVDIANKGNVRCDLKVCTPNDCCAKNVDECLIPTNNAVCRAVGQQCFDDKLAANLNNWQCDCTSVYCDPNVGLVDIAAKAAHRCPQKQCAVTDCCAVDECTVPAKGGLCRAAGQKCTDADTAVANNWQCDCTGIVCKAADGLMDLAAKAAHKCTAAPCTVGDCCVALTDECNDARKGVLCAAAGQLCTDQTAATANDWQCHCTNVFCDPGQGLVDIANKGNVRCDLKVCTPNDCCAVDECTVPAKGGLCRAVGQKCTDADTAVANNWQCDCTGIVCKAADGLMDLAAKAAHKCTAAPCTVGDCCVALTDECKDAKKGGLCAAAGQLCTDQTAATANDWQCHCTNVFCDPGQGLVDIANKGNVRCDLKVCTPNDCCAVDECTVPAKGGLCRAAGQKCTDADTAVANNWQCDCTGIVCKAADGLMDLAAKAAHKCTAAPCTVGDCCVALTDECNDARKGGLCAVAGQLCTDQTAATANDWQCHCGGVYCDGSDGLMDIANKNNVRCDLSVCTANECCVKNQDECSIPANYAVCNTARQYCNDPNKNLASRDDWTCECSNVVCDPNANLQDRTDKSMVTCTAVACKTDNCCEPLKDECAIPNNLAVCSGAGQQCIDDKIAANRDNWNCDCSGVYCDPAMGLMDHTTKGTNKCLKARCTPAECCMDNKDECSIPANYAVCNTAKQYCNDPNKDVASRDDWTCDCSNVVCDPNANLQDRANKNTVTCTAAACKANECCEALTDECRIPKNGGICAVVSQNCFDTNAASTDSWACDCSGVFCDPAAGLQDAGTKGTQRCERAACTVKECCAIAVNECLIAANNDVCAARGQNCFDTDVSTAGTWKCDCSGVFCDVNVGLRDVTNKISVRCDKKSCTVQECCQNTVNECLVPANMRVCTAAGQKCSDPTAGADNWRCDCSAVICNPADSLTDKQNRHLQFCTGRHCVEADCCTATTNECLVTGNSAICLAAGQNCVDTNAAANNWACDCAGVYCNPAAGLQDIASKDTVKCERESCTQKQCCTSQTDECLIPEHHAVCTAAVQDCHDDDHSTVNTWKCDCGGVYCDPSQGLLNHPQRAAVRCNGKACTKEVCCQSACSNVYCHHENGNKDRSDKAAIRCGLEPCTVDECCDGECSVTECNAAQGWANKPTKRAVTCPAKRCFTENCCDGTCANVECNPRTGLKDKENKAGIRCQGVLCTTVECCNVDVLAELTCQTDAECRTHGDTRAKCQSGTCVCTRDFELVSRKEGVQLQICVLKGTVMEATSVPFNFRLRYADGDYWKLTHADRQRLKEAYEEQFGAAVDMVFSPGSIHVGVSGVIPWHNLASLTPDAISSVASAWSPPNVFGTKIELGRISTIAKECTTNVNGAVATLVDRGGCVVTRCDEGHWHREPREGQCHHDDELTKTQIVLIVVGCAVFVALFVIAIVLLCSMFRQKKGEKEEPEFDEA